MDYKNTKSIKRQRKGQESVEWWVIISAVSVLVMFTLVNWGGELTEIIQNVQQALGTVNSNVTTTGT